MHGSAEQCSRAGWPPSARLISSRIVGVGEVGDRQRQRPENAAAIVNALVVLVGPIALLFLLSQLPESPSDTSVTVRAPGASSWRSALAVIGSMLPGLGFGAVVAGWRTRVNARRWLDAGRGDWRGVGEAALFGFAVALLVLSHGIITRPLEAAPYVIAYGGVAAVLGAIVGIILRFTGLITLRILEPDPLIPEPDPLADRPSP